MTDKERIEWQLKYLTNRASELIPNDLDWAIRMEEAYQQQGHLTKRQQEVLSNIIKKY